MRIFLAILFFMNALLVNGEEFFRKNYSDHWIVFDETSKSFVPVLGNASEYRTIHLFIDLVLEAGKKIEICSSAEISILLDGKIVGNDNPNGCVVWTIDSIQRQYRKESVQLSIYKVDESADIETSILYPALGFVPDESPNKIRLTKGQTNFTLFGLILIGLVTLLIREFNHRFFEEFSSVTKIFSLRVRSSQLYMLKPYSREIFFMILLQSLGISFLTISLGTFFTGEEQSLYTENQTLWSLVQQWALMALMFSLVVYLQFIILFITNLFFKNLRILHIQFYDNLRIIHFSLVALFLIMMLSFAISTDVFSWLLSHLWILIIGLFVIKGIVIYLKMLNESSHRKLHIFSYFCATEILPVVLVVKIVFS